MKFFIIAALLALASLSQGMEVLISIPQEYRGLWVAVADEETTFDVPIEAAYVEARTLLFGTGERMTVSLVGQVVCEDYGTVYTILYFDDWSRSFVLSRPLKEDQGLVLWQSMCRDTHEEIARLIVRVRR